MAPYLLIRRECFLLRFTDGRARVWRRCGQDPFQDNVVAETEMFDVGSIMVWGSFSHDHKLDLVVVRQALKGQRYIDDILQPIVYPHFRAHQAARPIFLDGNACPRGARVFTQSIAQTSVAQQESRYEFYRAHCWNRIGRNVSKRDDTVTLSMILHLLPNGTIWSPSFFED